MSWRTHIPRKLSLLMAMGLGFGVMSHGLRSQPPVNEMHSLNMLHSVCLNELRQISGNHMLEGEIASAWEGDGKAVDLSQDANQKAAGITMKAVISRDKIDPDPLTMSCHDERGVIRFKVLPSNSGATRLSL